jgi:Sap, sulfolipid-1-addressing protein
VTVDLLLLAAAISVDPIPISAYILLLGSRHGTAKGWGFLSGWLACVVAVVVAAGLLTGGRPPKPSTAPSTLALVIRIAGGLVLLALAWRHRRHLGRPHAKPRWEAKLDRVGVGGAAGIAVLLQPWGMTAAGAATVTRANLAKPEAVLTLLVFCLLTSVSYLAMQAGAVVRPQATHARLEGLKLWIDTHRDQAVIVLYVVVGTWLIGRGVYLLT